MAHLAKLLRPGKPFDKFFAMEISDQITVPNQSSRILWSNFQKLNNNDMTDHQTRASWIFRSDLGRVKSGIEMCWAWKVPGVKSARMEKCREWKVTGVKSAGSEKYWEWKVLGVKSTGSEKCWEWKVPGVKSAGSVKYREWKVLGV